MTKEENHLEAIFDFVNSHLTLMESAYLEYTYPEPSENQRIKLPKPKKRPIEQYLTQFLPTSISLINQNNLLGQHCPICLQSYLSQQKSRQLKCGHAYHLKCIDRWLDHDLDQLSCPVCRQSQY